MDYIRRWIMHILAIVFLLFGKGDFSKMAREMLKEKVEEQMKKFLP